MDENGTYDTGIEEIDARSAAALAALEHKSANLREAAEMRAKTALDLRATSDAQVKVASTISLINRSLSGAFKALAALRAKIVAYGEETEAAAAELLAEAEEIENSLRANQEETFAAVTHVLGTAMAEISGPDEEAAGPRAAETGEETGAEGAREGAEPEAAGRGEAPAKAEEAAGASPERKSIADRVPGFELDEPDGVEPTPGGEDAGMGRAAAGAQDEAAVLKKLVAEVLARSEKRADALEEKLTAALETVSQQAELIESLRAERDEAPGNGEAQGEQDPEPCEEESEEQPAPPASDDADVPEDAAEASGSAASPEEESEDEQRVPAASEPACEPDGGEPRGLRRTGGFGGSAAERVRADYEDARSQAPQPSATEQKDPQEPQPRDEERDMDDGVKRLLTERGY